jgi:NlpC/P60 family
MVRQILPAIAFIFFLSSCSSLKPLNFTSNKQVVPVPISTRFIDDISLTPPAAEEKTEIRQEQSIVENNNTKSSTRISETPVPKQDESELSRIMAARSAAEVESASATQLKYSVLMNTEVEALPSKFLLENVDEWYGVRYRRGGNTKSGVDCSGFTLAVYAAVYGITIPRVSREQYRISRKISTTELQEGDLVFFNTTGRGVSHVGVYLGNNKFIHASVSRGVMVNDLFESYYLKRYIGAGRIDNKQMLTSN